MPSQAELRDKVRRLRRKLKKLERSKLKRKLNTARADLADMSNLVDEQHRDHQEVVANLHSHIEAMKTTVCGRTGELAALRKQNDAMKKTIGDLGQDRDNAVALVKLSREHVGIVEAELRKEREEHEVTKGIAYSIMRAFGFDTVSVRHRGLSPEHRERLIMAAARIRTFEVSLGKAIHAYANAVHEKDYGTGERKQAAGVVEGLQVAASLYKGTERTLEAPPITNTYLDGGFIANDIHVILEMTSRYMSTYDRESRYSQVHLILTQIANHADLKADFVRCVNDLVGDLRRQHATEISPPPPKAN